ncbi:tRNA 2-selenouridine(34) synthase MnmH [Alkalibacterium thalassium]|uniref:tRNA 2-selenouridine synthase n=1 Tax=Alkalibacterium thalassium TaxID=426701 RepID=A0A1G8ZTT6_9LACT|nr:tRNA 2-selenouridine(34) synthase MnmH [Alkalibacterium thalassium]SDK17550.1 tRNA 2-selenouridine synthase [Alkalibacterium thalassium]
MFKDISPSDLFELKEAGHVVVDVRAPKEFKEATIPGAINIPLFSDEERAQVGTTYKHQGQEAAKELGLEIFSKKLPDFIRQFKELKSPVTVFCWRGGMRSTTAATVTDLMNIKVNRLTGGIRAYRNWMKEQIDTLPLPPFYVLNGHTGNGKTHILRQLKQENYPVIDFEGMARHRGSIFGQIGLEPSNQRMFNLLLGEELLRYQQSPYILVEGESARIGKVIIPERIFQHKEISSQLVVDLPLEERVAIILDDYSPDAYHNDCLLAFERIRRRIHTPVSKAVGEALETGDYPEAVKLLLTYYYDPHYNRSITRSDAPETSIEASTLEEAVDKVRTQLDSLNKIRQQN